MTSSASAAQVIIGQGEAASSPAGGIPLVVWDGDFVSTGLPGSLSPSRQLLPLIGGDIYGVAVAQAGARTVLAAVPFFSGSRLAPPSFAGVFFGVSDPGGRVRLTRVLPPDVAAAPVIAGSTAGDALLAWGNAVDRMAPGGALRPPVTAGRLEITDAAIDGNGNATVVGYSAGHVVASSAPRNGGFGPATELPPLRAVTARVSSGPGGQTAVVVLSANDGLQLFYRPQPGAPFGAAENLANTSAQIVGTAVDGHGRVLVAWIEPDASTNLRLYAMITDEAGHATPATVLSAAGHDVLYIAAAVAMNEAGDAAAVWEESASGTGRSGDGPPHIYAALRPAGAQFGPAQQVTPAGRQASIEGDPVVTLGSDATALLVWPDVAEGTVTNPPRFMAARLTTSGLSGVTRLNTGPPTPAPVPATPPLLQAGLALGGVQRVGPSSGRLNVAVRCTSWTLDPCRGHVLIADRHGRSLAANRTISVDAGRRSTFTLRLKRSSRRVLKSGRSIRATVRVTLAGASSQGASKSIVLQPRL